jgi:threonine synthase
MDGLVCRSCGLAYALDDARWRCDCGGLLDVQFQPVFDLQRIKQRPPTMWRYREAIPVQKDRHIISLGEGFTPLVEVDFDGRSVLVKLDCLFPTGSFKDRGASVLVSKVKELAIDKVVEDSSGNAGCAIAAYCARANIACDVYIPESTSPAKAAQIRLYGARLQLVPGSREDTARAVVAAAQKLYYASHVWNPFFVHGTKTFAFEVSEQLGWQSPDAVVVPLGHGSLLLGLYLGFRELQQAGIVQQVPQIIAVQSANCAPLYHAFAQGAGRPFGAEGGGAGQSDWSIPPAARRDTIAEGVAIAEPIRGKQVLDAVRHSGGIILAVDEAEIKTAVREVGKKGFYIEPTSAVAIAGLRRFLQEHHPQGVIVSVFTGHGLKATEKMLRLLQS